MENNNKTTNLSVDKLISILKDLKNNFSESEKINNKINNDLFEEELEEDILPGDSYTIQDLLDEWYTTEHTIKLLISKSVGLSYITYHYQQALIGERIEARKVLRTLCEDEEEFTEYSKLL